MDTAPGGGVGISGFSRLFLVPACGMGTVHPVWLQDSTVQGLAHALAVRRVPRQQEGTRDIFPIPPRTGFRLGGRYPGRERRDCFAVPGTGTHCMFGRVVHNFHYTRRNCGLRLARVYHVWTYHLWSSRNRCGHVYIGQSYIGGPCGNRAIQRDTGIVCDTGRGQNTAPPSPRNTEP